MENIQMVKKTSKLKLAFKQKYLFLMSLPIVAWLILFTYVPLTGWSYAFVNFKPSKQVWECDFVGFKYFGDLFKDPKYWNAFTNTIIMSALALFFCNFLCPIFFAIVLNETRSRKLKRVVQTISYLPHFVSWVVVSGIVIQMLSPSGGLIHTILETLGLVGDKTNLMSDPNNFYAIITSAKIWKELGWNAIIYISAITGIDQELYEAANVDGAGRLRRIWNVTLPGIRGTVIILMIMNLGSLFGNGFEPQMLLSNAMTQEVAEVVGLYVLKYGIQIGRYSFGTAAGIVTSLLSFILVFSANFTSKKITEEGLF